MGSQIVSGGKTILAAGNDLNARAASVNAKGDLAASAGGDIRLTEGRATNQSDTAISTGFGGKTVTLASAGDTLIRGSSVIGDNGTAVIAGNDLTIEAATNTSQSSSFNETKKNGLFSSGGLSITLGQQQLSTDQNRQSTSTTASTVGSIGGDVTLLAGQTYSQIGSDVLAPSGDISIAAKKVDIVAANNTYANSTEQRFKQSGLTLAVTSPIISAMQTVQQMAQAASQTDDGRMKALAGATAGLAAKGGYDAIQAGQGTTINGKANQIATGSDAQGNPTSRDATAAEQAGGINLSISIGASSSENKTTQTGSHAAGSTVAAGGNVTIVASGAGKDSDVTVQGSDISAGNNVVLSAEDELKLLAAKNTDEQHSTNKSSSGSIGISIGTSGFGVTASASSGRGNADGKDVSWTNTHINAGNQVAMHSGGDTTLKGAVVEGKQVMAEVGGDLLIESLQDTSEYDSKQKNMSGSITIGAGGGGSFSYSKSCTSSDYASVTEQSGIKAGDGGFQVKVEGNTDLKGAVIASTDKAVEDSRNSLVTASLTTSDIQNKAEYEGKSAGVSLGAGSQGGVPSLTGAGIGSDDGYAASVTQSGVSGIAGNKDVRSGDKETGIAKIFDADKVQKEINAQVVITQAFGQQAGKAVSDYVQAERKTLWEQLKNAPEDKKESIQTQLSDLAMQERAMNILIGAVSGMGASAVTKETLSVAADEMRRLTIESSRKFAGVVDQDGNTLTNLLDGKSEGIRGDGIGSGGTRVDLDKLCGVDNSRCAIQKNPDDLPILGTDGKPKLALKNGQVEFLGNLNDFIKTPEGEKMVGATGGIQGYKGTLFGKPYEAGSWQDKLIESFGGTHDFIGGQLSGLYDEQGNAQRGRNDAQQAFHETWSTLAIVPSIPFSMSELLPPEVWQAISILLRNSK